MLKFAASTTQEPFHDKFHYDNRIYFKGGKKEKENDW